MAGTITVGELLSDPSSSNKITIGTGTTLDLVSGAGSVIHPAPVGMDDVSGVARATSGLLFNGDTATANALDDYEEGSWTPAVTSTGGSLVIAIGNYTKIGRVVQCFCFLQSSTSYTYANSTDIWTITGVPFAEAQQGYTGHPGSFYGKLNWNNNGSASTTNSIVTPTLFSTSIELNVCNSSDADGGNARIKCANNSGFIVQINITYYTNA